MAMEYWTLFHGFAEMFPVTFQYFTLQKIMITQKEHTDVYDLKI